MGGFEENQKHNRLILPSPPPKLDVLTHTHRSLAFSTASKEGTGDALTIGCVRVSCWRAVELCFLHQS